MRNLPSIAMVRHRSWQDPQSRGRPDGLGFRAYDVCFGVPFERRQQSSELVKRLGEPGVKQHGLGMGQVAADGDGFLDGGQCLLLPPQIGQQERVVVQRPGEIGQECVRPGTGQVTVDGDGFVDGGQGLLPPPQIRQSDRTGCSAIRRGRAGMRRAGRGPGHGRW